MVSDMKGDIWVTEWCKLFIVHEPSSASIQWNENIQWCFTKTVSGRWNFEICIKINCSYMKLVSTRREVITVKWMVYRYIHEYMLVDTYFLCKKGNTFHKSFTKYFDNCMKLKLLSVTQLYKENKYHCRFEL
jgi:hypothetical protein